MKESVQRAYSWAFSIAGNRKSGVVELFCAKQIIKAVESNERYESAYAAIEALVREWSGRPGYADLAHNVGRMLADQ